ncbi:hypothetical protein [Paeniglutamicibacter kerguelensis]|uniref:Uncharacterized protein n=1 Tax=Paeniglutamicibacter kerguelensis TaxID=254788 RepID=A0ABS4XCZ3_9MICC|nr:hypothetical protein [Paeniglutamicibacter kerguelensis]MBP2386331.1 hypothetical protein [Paeniglutamicibacter kerguelensis]
MALVHAGAWGKLFFEQILTVWVAATAALLIVIFRRDGERYRMRRAIALLLPSLWLVLAFAGKADGSPLDVMREVLGSAIAVVGIPATMWVLARIIWPELGVGLSLARRVLVIASVLFIAVSAYLLGVNHAAFLTCEDFTVSGNSEPRGCTPKPRGQDPAGGAAVTAVLPPGTVPGPTWGDQHD